MKNLRLPFGVQDYLPEECFNKNSVQEELAEVFVKHGFSRVGIPAIEYFDVYSGVLGKTAVNKTFKMTDSDGSLLMLRCDPTMQICRMAESKLDTKKVSKVYYIENSYEYISDPTTARSREFPQAGVELLGASGVAGDIEAITVAIESLLGAGLEDFMLELGQVDYFNGIACDAGMTDSDANELRGLINKKDMLGVEMFLRKNNINESFIAQFLKLPALFGDADILVKAREGVSNARSRRAVDNLEEIMRALAAMGLDKYVSVDLGLLRGDYYTGLVMKGYTGALGLPILDGGRYDKLGEAFGTDLPAVGFSIGVKRLLIALERADKLKRLPAADVAYISHGTDYAFEYEYISDLRKKGLKVEKCFFETAEELTMYCRGKRIKNTLLFLFGKVICLKGKV